MISEETIVKLQNACAVYTETDPAACALDRLAQHIGGVVAHLNLSAVGETLGLSRSESEGIMDGWDVGVGALKNGVFHSAYYVLRDEFGVTDDQMAEYEAGRQLGLDLAAKYGPART